MRARFTSLPAGLIAAFWLVTAAFCLGSSPADAQLAPRAAASAPDPTADSDGDGIQNFLEEPGWWSRMDPNRAGWSGYTYEQTWLYREFPIACNDNPNAPAYQVLWVVPRGQKSKAIPLDGRMWQVRNVLHEAASGFAASAQAVVSSPQKLLKSHAPRFVTQPGSGPFCQPKVKVLEVPYSVLAARIDQGEPDNLTDWLADRGYTDSLRKYVVFVQKRGWDYYQNFGGVYTGWATGANPTVTDASNAANRGGAHEYIIVPTDGTFFASNAAASLLHELAHSVGGVNRSAPHNNPLNTAHPSDCFDILCYNSSFPQDIQQSYLKSCGRGVGDLGLDQDESQASYRLDCNHDDYFGSPSQVKPGSWLATHWNGYDNVFLWGGLKPVSSQRTFTTVGRLTPVA